jgi:hypothetical protein
MPRNVASVSVGRLLEVRVEAGYRTPADVDEIFQAIRREVGKLAPGTRHVTVVDWRRCALMSPEAADYMAKLIAGANSSTERSAALASNDSPMAVLQFVRVIRDAKSPERKLFTDTRELSLWLSEVLSNPERTRLREFLAEPRQ